MTSQRNYIRIFSLKSNLNLSKQTMGALKMANKRLLGVSVTALALLLAACGSGNSASKGTQDKALKVTSSQPIATADPTKQRT